jgi:hypothetical protein
VQLVIPTQFVLFNLSAIVGSAILFGDFARASFHQIVTFLYGCAATFAGVFVIAWTPGPPPRAEDAEGEAPTVGGGLDAAHEGKAPRAAARGALPARGGALALGELCGPHVRAGSVFALLS